MQTFLPYPDLRASCVVLDDERLGKQRVETFQVLRALTWRATPGRTTPRPGRGAASSPGWASTACSTARSGSVAGSPTPSRRSCWRGPEARSRATRRCRRGSGGRTSTARTAATCCARTCRTTGRRSPTTPTSGPRPVPPVAGAGWSRRPVAAGRAAGPGVRRSSHRPGRGGRGPARRQGVAGRAGAVDPSPPTGPGPAAGRARGSGAACARVGTDRARVPGSGGAWRQRRLDALVVGPGAGQDVASYAVVAGCRRRALLDRLGQPAPERCGPL